jgi:hypothetical protein
MAAADAAAAAAGALTLLLDLATPHPQNPLARQIAIGARKFICNFQDRVFANGISKGGLKDRLQHYLYMRLPTGPKYLTSAYP